MVRDGFLKHSLFSSVPSILVVPDGVCYIPLCSMHAVFAYIYHKFKLNVGRYSRHSAHVGL